MFSTENNSGRILYGRTGRMEGILYQGVMILITTIMIAIRINPIQNCYVHAWFPRLVVLHGSSLWFFGIKIRDWLDIDRFYLSHLRMFPRHGPVECAKRLNKNKSYSKLISKKPFHVVYVTYC